MSAKPTTKTTPRKSAAKSSPKRGNMKPGEIKPLIMAARKAYDCQVRFGLVDGGESFDTWRHRQCMAAVGKPGITACNHENFRPLLAHFQTLAGDESGAFANLLKSGRPTDHAAPGDTHEARRELAHTISQILAVHHRIAVTSADELLAGAKAELEAFQPGAIWEQSPGPRQFALILARKAAIEAHGKGPIGVGYLIWITRQKTRRPDLQLGQDWKAALADRCTVSQLTQIRDTMVNRINAVEGLGSTQGRNKAQRTPRAKAARSPKNLDDRRF